MKAIFALYAVLNIILDSTANPLFFDPHVEAPINCGHIICPLEATTCVIDYKPAPDFKSFITVTQCLDDAGVVLAEENAKDDFKDELLPLTNILESSSNENGVPYNDDEFVIMENDDEFVDLQSGHHSILESDDEFDVFGNGEFNFFRNGDFDSFRKGEFEIVENDNFRNGDHFQYKNADESRTPEDIESVPIEAGKKENDGWSFQDFFNSESKFFDRLKDFLNISVFSKYFNIPALSKKVTE